MGPDADKEPFDEMLDAQLFNAFRYSLGRRTYAAKQTVDFLAENWPRLSAHTRMMIKLEIARKIDPATASEDMDAREWLRLLDPEPAAGEPLPTWADDEREQITERALALIAKFDRPIGFELSIQMLVAIIGQISLAFRHPHNQGAMREMAAEFVTDVINGLDPGRGDLYQFLMMSFDQRYDE